MSPPYMLVKEQTKIGIKKQLPCNSYRQFIRMRVDVKEKLKGARCASQGLVDSEQ